MSTQYQQSALSPRLAAQLALGLSARCKCPHLQGSLTAEARALGLTTGEIEASRQGRSFDVRDATALSLALALQKSAADIKLHRAKAEQFGMSADLIAAIEQFSHDFAPRLEIPEVIA
ncbi:hypothetical protein [Stenotrophobium rhamnosiphilum]|uniref:Carboxymuconolactone decarboxylase-like domain-containing protein n=1 Tax=Stenotrophobium rhamnosiphilum TaxID=2029166 RepID=A0A2T5ME96_9GAMM|nr:hypothetical protein [Stenotrophobium rhamnosiphilum]PTU30886.1 hypothetical protein CJD38_11280 [Stenotrophobium rhamnosiphilum]